MVSPLFYRYGNNRKICSYIPVIFGMRVILLEVSQLAIDVMHFIRKGF